MKKLLTLALFIASTYSAHAQLIINEIMQSNVECIMDDIKEFPDSWVELYNSGDEAINLKDYKISNKNKEKKAWQLPDKTVAAKGYAIIYCDKEGKENNRLHADFRLESGKGCTVYLFNNKEVVDSLPYIDEKPMVKMPAPDIESPSTGIVTRVPMVPNSDPSATFSRPSTTPVNGPAPMAPVASSTSSPGSRIRAPSGHGPSYRFTSIFISQYYCLRKKSLWKSFEEIYVGHGFLGTKRYFHI